MTGMTVSASEAGRTCPYCRFPLKPGAIAERCDGCGTIHHQECWQEGAGCAVHGCASSGGYAAATVAGTAGHTTATPGAPFQATRTAPPDPPVYRRQDNRTPMLAVLVLLVLVGGGVAGYLIAHSNNRSAASPTTVVTQTVITAATPASASAPASSASAIDVGLVSRLASIVEFSQRGRAAVQNGQYAVAIANRTSTLDRLAALIGGSPAVRQAKQTFTRAIEASLDSDRAYEAGQDPDSYDAQATILKREFVAEFNPIARRDGLPTFSALKI